MRARSPRRFRNAYGYGTQWNDMQWRNAGVGGATGVHQILNTISQPLNELGRDKLMPGSVALEEINDSFR